MKINEPQPIGIYKNYNQSVEFRAQARSVSQRKDEVQISVEAKELLDSKGRTGADRAEKIEMLKREVAAGTYHVDSGKIAERLLPFFLK